MNGENVQDKLDRVLTNLGMNTKAWSDTLSLFRNKLKILEQSATYEKLLKSLFSSRDLNEFNSYVFEVQFAYDFHAKGQPLSYETRKIQKNLSTVDFCFQLNESKKIFFELRLIQQRDWITKLITSQIKYKKCYAIELNGNNEKHETIRLQNLILSKCQDKNGNPIKFAIGNDVINIIVVNVSELHLGMIDKYDCLLTTYGDSVVSFYCRRGIFGLWQQLSQHPSEQDKELYRKFEHIRESIHGILFVRHVRNSGCLDRLFIDRELEYFLVVNNNLLQQKDSDLIIGSLEFFLRTWTKKDSKL